MTGASKLFVAVAAVLMVTAEAVAGTVEAVAGTAAEAGTAEAVAGMVEAVAGTAGVAGTKPAVGTAGVAGTTMVGISAGTNTDGAARDGGGVLPPPNLGAAGAGAGLSAAAPDGGIGGLPGAGTISVGDGAQAPGRGVACWWVRHSA